MPILIINLVMSVAAAKPHTEAQALVEDTKQRGQAYKAIGPACFVICQLLAL